MYAIALLLRLPTLPEDMTMAIVQACAICLFLGFLAGTLAVYAIGRRREKEQAARIAELEAENKRLRESSSDSPS